MNREKNDFEFWLHLLGNQNPLASREGLSAWSDGVALLKQLQSRSFFELQAHEERAFKFLKNLRRKTFVDFDVVGGSLLEFSSPMYRAVQTAACDQNVTYLFSDDSSGNFNPWSNIVELGTKFFGCFEGRPTVPFYSFNHENAHVALFGRYYANLPLTDEALKKLLLLFEWFCISLDLVLAYDLKSHGFHEAVRQMDSITPSQEFFSKHIQSFDDVERVAERFRTTFLNGVHDDLVYEMISPTTLTKHNTYTVATLLKECRERPEVSVPAEDILRRFESFRLSDLLFEYTDTNYGA